MTLFVLAFLYLTYFGVFLFVAKVQTAQSGEPETADAPMRLSLPGYLTPFIFTAVFFLGDGSETAQPLPFKYLQTPGSASVYSNKTKK